jgi:AraC-like DNA-binding protein/mannose-6-phosphate isomerase-like protein (cupin superfamily)
MRPKLEKLGNTTNSRSFTCYKVSVPLFEFYWHFHPEYELTLILSGKGNRIIGNNIEPFNSGDLVLLGANLPHVWVSDEKDPGPCEAIVIQFPEAFIQNLLHFPEWNHLNYLLQNAGRGLAYSNIETEKLENLTSQMRKIMETRSLSGLIELLCSLITIDSRPLTPDVFSYHKSSKNTTRLNAVLHFIQMHFLKPITLENAAASIHLSESAFSKLFIRNMGKPFTTYLNELRIAHASRLLIETDYPISYVAQASGFENLSYFNRVFLQQKKLSPRQLRKIKKG